MTNIIPTFSTGVKTHRDHFVISFDEDTLHKRISDFRNLDLLDQEIADMYSLKDTRDWKINKRRLSLLECSDWEKYFTQCLYRPFDLRAYYHHKDVVELPREAVMRHMLAGENLGLITCRQQSQQGLDWSLVGVTNKIMECCAISNKTKEINTLFPLYLYPTAKTDLFNLEILNNQRRPNFAPEFITDLENRLKLTFIPNGCGDFEKTIGPEDIFYYIYAIFHSPTYRQRYAEFLKIDFPRVPITDNKSLFQQLAALGQKLVKIHPMEADKLNSDSSFPMERVNIINKVTYKNERVYINQTQYFDNVKLEIWQYHIGGYQVAEKWLKDRKGRTLNYDDYQHYLYILAALDNTLTLMQNIDETVPNFPLK